jgi:hypothetical protein
METHSKILVNNMICETLHPKNIIAQYYTFQFKYGNEIKDKIFSIQEKPEEECETKKEEKNNESSKNKNKEKNARKFIPRINKMRFT